MDSIWEWNIRRQPEHCLKYHLPLNEIIYDFFDALKSRSRGYASFDYEMKGYEQSDLVKLDIPQQRRSGRPFLYCVCRSAYERGRKMCEKLKEENSETAFLRYRFRPRSEARLLPETRKSNAQRCIGKMLRR